MSVGDDVNNCVLTLIEAGDKLAEEHSEKMAHSEKIDIPTIVITDITSDRGDQGEIVDVVGVENTEMKDEFTAIVSETPGNTNSVPAENMTQEIEKQIEFSNILIDSLVTTEGTDININADEVSNDAEVKIVVQQESDSSDDTKRDDCLVDNNSEDKTVVLNADSKTEVEVKHQLEDIRSNVNYASEVKEDAKEEGMKEEIIDTAALLRQHESSTEVWVYVSCKCLNNCFNGGLLIAADFCSLSVDCSRFF